MSSAESRSIRVASWPAGTVVAYWSSALAGPVPEMGEDASFGFEYTRPAVRPSAVSAIGPVVPGVTGHVDGSRDPLPLHLVRRGDGDRVHRDRLRTVVSPSVQVRDPVA